MILSKRKRILLASILILIGIILCKGKEYFIGTIVILSSIFLSLNIGTTERDKLAWVVLGLCFLSGAMLSFFYPKLIFVPFVSDNLTKSFSVFVKVFLTIVGIFMISQGIYNRK